MNLLLRPPREDEWPVCRMLLPETFGDAAGREYLLALRAQAPRVVAAASFRQGADSLRCLRLHVVPSMRRCGVGSRMVEHLALNGERALEGSVEITREQAAVVFCERNRFGRVDGLTIVEGDLGEMREHLLALRARLTPPEGASVTPIREAPADEVARLHARYVAHDDEWNPWRTLVAGTAVKEHSLAAMVKGRVAGILLGELEGATAVVRSRVVEPSHQGGWVNAMLLAEGLDRAWNAGARRVRFFYTDSNRDTQKLAGRFRAEIVSVMARFLRPAA